MLRHRVSMVVLAFAMTLPALTAAQNAPAGTSEQQVQRLEKERFAAMAKVDEAALNKLLSDDVVYIHSTALLQNKKEFIASLKEGGIKYVSVTPSDADVKVRIMGNVALVNGLAAVHVFDHGAEKHLKIRYTDVHVNRNGVWQLVSWQSTAFP